MDNFIKAARESFWDELDEKGKCERLRQQVKSLQKVVDRLARESEKMGAHLHVGDKLVVSMFGLPCEEREQNSRRNAEYF